MMVLVSEYGGGCRRSLSGRTWLLRIEVEQESGKAAGIMGDTKKERDQGTKASEREGAKEWKGQSVSTGWKRVGRICEDE
jgi:hypothetical protein